MAALKIKLFICFWNIEIGIAPKLKHILCLNFFNLLYFEGLQIKGIFSDYMLRKVASTYEVEAGRSL